MNYTVIELISDTSPEALLNELHKLRLLGHLCDVTIQVEHQGVIEEFEAHRPVLAVASKYFKELFLGEKAENGPVAKVCLQDMQAADFASFLEFVYTARVEVEEGRVDKILEVAKALECSDLVETCNQLENIVSRPSHSDLQSSHETPTDRAPPDIQVKAEANFQPVCSEVLIHLDASCKSGMKTSLQSGKPADKAERKKEASKAVQAKSRRSSTRLAGRKVFVDIPKKKYMRKLKEEQRAAEQTSEVESCAVEQSTPDAEMEESHNGEEVVQETGVQAESAQEKNMPDNENQDVAERGCNDCDSEMEEDHPKDVEESNKDKSEMFRCDSCQRDFQYEKSYLKHIQLSHGIIPEIIYRCDTCNQTFANRCNLKSHQRHVHSNERNFPCEICTKMFKRKKDVKRHVLQVHEGGGERHMCPLCGKSLSSKTALKLHERTHTGDKPYECPECETKFSQPSALKTHRRIHTGEKPFICDECGAKFTQNHMLIYHKRCHTGEKPFMCEICGKSFASKEYLKHHSRMHTGSKPFKCDVCARTFAQRNSLHQHLKVHTGERPYCCDQCGKQFTQLNALQRHHRIHTGEKPYMCRLCGRKFTDKSTVRRHTMIHDKETHWKNFLVILDSNSKKDPKRRMKQGDQTEFSKLHEESSSCSETMVDQTEAAPEETRIESEQVPSATEWNSAGPAAITLVNQGASIATALSGFTVIHTDAAQHHLQAMVNIEHIGETNTQVVSLDNQVGITVPVCIPVLSQINNILTRSSATVQDPSSTAVPMPSEEPQLTVMHNVSIQAVEDTANNVNCIVPPEM